MALLDTLLTKRAEVLGTASRHGASNVRLFGSVARRSDTPSSNVDILIDLAEDRGFSDFLALAEELEELIGRKVDLVTSRGLSPYLKLLIEEEIFTLKDDGCCSGTTNTAFDRTVSFPTRALRAIGNPEQGQRPCIDSGFPVGSAGNDTSCELICPIPYSSPTARIPRCP